MIKWGILGAGNIAHRFAASLRNLDDCTLYAISGRSQEKLSAFAEAYPCEKIYLSHEELLRDPEVDAVYLALPHGMHTEWAIAALSARKAVLCEKPAALDRGQMAAIRDCAVRHGTLFMEAMKTRFTPLYRQIRQMVMEDKVIGDLIGIDTSLCFTLPAESYGKTYHTDLSQGGCLLDSGVYCASWLEDYAAGAPKLQKIYANVRQGVDFYVDAALRFGDMDASLETAFDRSKEKRAVLYGTKGRIEVLDLHRPTKAILSVTGESREIEAAYEHDDFYGQIRHFCDRLLQGKTESDVMPLAASVRCAEILDTIRDGFTKYDANDLCVLEAQERDLTFDRFTSATAMDLGNRLVALDAEYDLPIAVRIVSEPDGSVLFQHIMDGKTGKNIQYAEGKRQTVLHTGHSSAWATVKRQIDGTFLHENPDCLLSGGAFPIIAGGRLAATAAVSGLHEGKDHELVVRALAGLLERPDPTQLKKALF